MHIAETLASFGPLPRHLQGALLSPLPGVHTPHFALFVGDIGSSLGLPFLWAAAGQC